MDMVNGYEYDLVAIDAALAATDADFADSIDMLDGVENTVVVNIKTAGAASADNKWTISLYDSDDDTTYAAVTSNDALIGEQVTSAGVLKVIDNTNTTAFAAGTQIVFGYRGTKRYLRIGLVKAEAAPNMAIDVTHIKGRLRNTA